MVGRAGICALVLFLSGAMGRAEAAGWRLEELFGGQRATACSIAVGADGVAHLAYYGIPYYGLQYARRDPATGWVEEFSNYQYSISEDIAIQIDAVGRPRIAYTDPEFSGRSIPRLKLAENLEGGWTVDAVSERLVYAASMGLLKGTEPFIAYADYYDGQSMHVATKRDGTWVTHKVTNNAVGATALAVDNDADAVHIVYFDVNERALKYARLALGRWEFETIERLGPDEEGRAPFSMTLDASGQPVAAYAFDGRIRVARRSHGAWQIQLLPEDSGARLFRPVVQVDARDNLHVAYGKILANNQPQLRYARTRMGAWQMETVDDHAPWANGLSFVLDRHGAAHIVYVFDQVLFLKYATNRRPVVD